MAEALPCVAQQVGRYYLKESQNWIYHQVRALSSVRSVFLARERVPKASYPWNGVYTIEALPLPVRLYQQAVAEVTGYLPLHRNACRREGVRLVHIHFGGRAVRGKALARVLGVPLVVSFYGRDMYYHPEGLEGLRRKYRRLFAEGTGFVAEGPAARDQLVRIGCPEEKVHIHRLGVDVRQIPVIPREVSKHGPLRLLMAARFTEKKGLPYGVEAFCRLAREEPRLHLTIVGDAGDAKDGLRIRRRLLDLVATSGVADRVRFTGLVSDTELRILAREHHVFLHPSVHARDGDAEGGHPVVITELAATGMPIIATRHCDIPEVVEDHQTGWLCEERDVDGLVAALREAVSHPDRLTAYGLNGRRLVEHKYDVRRTTLDAVYREVLGQ